MMPVSWFFHPLLRLPKTLQRLSGLLWREAGRGNIENPLLLGGSCEKPVFGYNGKLPFGGRSGKVFDFVIYICSHTTL